MKKILLAVLTALAAVPCFAQSQFNASQYAQWRVPIVSGTAAGGTSIILSLSNAYTPQGLAIPFATAAPFSPITINDNTPETQTPTAVSLGPCPTAGFGPLCATITVSGGFTNSHGAALIPNVGSGTSGLYEAALAAKNGGGGIVVVDGSFGGTTANVVAGRGLYTNVSVNDNRPSSASFGGPAVISFLGSGTCSASATLYLVSSGSATNACSNTTATIAPFVAPRAGTLSGLGCSSTTGGVNASSGVVTVRTGALSSGTFTSTSLTATFGTSTSAADGNFAHAASIVAGQPVQVQITTQSGETLAGVACTLQFN